MTTRNHINLKDITEPGWYFARADQYRPWVPVWVDRVAMNPQHPRYSEMTITAIPHGQRCPSSPGLQSVDLSHIQFIPIDTSHLPPVER